MFIQVYLYEFYIQMLFTKSIPEWSLPIKYTLKHFYRNTLEHTLSHKLLSGVQFAKYILAYLYAKYTWMNIS